MKTYKELTGIFVCLLRINGKQFAGIGKTRSQAKAGATKLAEKSK